MPLSVLETVLYAEDLESAQWFYGTVLDLPLISRHPTRQVFFRHGTGVLLIFAPRISASPGTSKMPVPPHGAHGPGHVAFACEDAHTLDQWRTRLVTHKIAIERDLTWPNGARSVYVRDPAQNSVEFAERSLWP